MSLTTNVNGRKVNTGEKPLGLYVANSNAPPGCSVICTILRIPLYNAATKARASVTHPPSRAGAGSALSHSAPHSTQQYPNECIDSLVWDSSPRTMAPLGTSP